MMYHNKLVASLKANGKILREFKDTVYIPFGSEYSFLLKNLHTQRALVNIYIDGENVIEGGLVLNAGQEVDLERYVKNGNLSAGNKFKFIERTNSIEQHRGVKLEDGLVRIEFQFELPRPVVNISDTMWRTDTDKFRYTGITGSPYNTPWYSTTNTNAGVSGSTGDRFTLTASGATSQMNVGGVLRGVDYSKGEATKAAASAAINSVVPQSGEIHDGSATMDWCDVGITVPGSKSTQSFQTVTMGAMESQKHSIVLKLLGETPDNELVRNPVTVKHKPKCVTCGKQNKATAKFCSECGTALEIFA
jgi:hypothetical protein